MEMTTDYCKHFNSEWFLETYHGSEDENSVSGKTIRFALRNLHKYFNSDVSFGNYLLDIGTGPSIWSILSASRRVQQIVLSDITSRNIQILREWKDGKRSDVSSHLQLEMEIAGESVLVSDKEAQIRSKVTGIQYIDVTQGKAIDDPNVGGIMFDVVTSSFCLETASNEKSKYILAVQNVSKLLKPGGYIVLIGGIEESFYRVDKFQFPVCHLTTEDIREIYEENGFQILSMDTLYPETELPDTETGDILADNKNVFTLFARKISL